MPHVAQPKPELCGSAWVGLQASISPSAFPNGFFRPPSHIPSPSSEPSRAQSLLENGDVVAPARSSADFKKGVTAGCHSRLDREKESWTRLEPEIQRRLGGTQAHNPSRRLGIDSAKPKHTTEPETQRRIKRCNGLRHGLQSPRSSKSTHPYQRGRASITGLRLNVEMGMKTGRLIGVACLDLFGLSMALVVVSSMGR
jgi:hypothetical protein